MHAALRPAFNPHLRDLECSRCARPHDLSAPRSVCEACGQPLLARYDLDAIGRRTSREDLGRFGSDLWRYRAVLPFAADPPTVRLGEGGTPLLPMARLASDVGVAELWLKEEAG